MRLRQERESQQLSIQKIAADTKIKSAYLEAIEADDLSALPGDYFYRAFVRQYAGYLGWDGATTEQLINTISSKPIVEPGIPSNGILEDRQMGELREKLKDKPMKLAQDDGSSKQWLVIAAVLIVACAGYFTYPQWRPGLATESNGAQANRAQANRAETNRAESNRAESNSAEAGSAVAQAPSQVQGGFPSPTATSQASTTIPPAAAPSQDGQVSQSAKAERLAVTPVPLKPEPGKFNLQLVARQMTWTRILADGSRVHLGPIEAGEQKLITASTAEVLIGNAGTLDVFYNGKPLQYGEKGQVKTLLFTPDGWKFKPKPVSQEDGESNRSSAGAQPGASDPSTRGF